ncbi:MAG: serine/threonine protein kinase, partial [Planctomycetaceae bacterium]|nr:serine/threonine protein kinase [Planctomycetaceae bacterium]
MKFTFPPESRPLPGYTIKRAIDRGGFGEVYYALSDAGKEVALKLLQHNLDVELRGVRQCLNLRHPNLVTIFDIRTDDEEDHWIVMEYAGGRTLEQTLAAAQQPFSPGDALAWMRGIADGVEFLHARGLVHRDLKPGNIFADQGTVKVGDVGLSKFITPSRRSAQTESVGTVHYMAPEVSRGRYGKEVDVYAAGVILYEMLAGKVPFDGESTAEILMKHLTATPDLTPIPSELRPLLERALEKDPERRLESIGDLATGLEQFVAGKQPTFPEA